MGHLTGRPATALLQKFYINPLPMRYAAAGWNDYLSSNGKYILMKRTNYFYHMLLLLAICGFMYCGGGNSGEPGYDDAQGYDSTAIDDPGNTDSLNAAHHRDPSIAFPRPPVTGSNQDSSRVKDTPNRPGY